jgi:uncharacterized membrane protein YiaA
MNIEQESNNDLIGDEWKNTTTESEESSFDESPIEESFYDTSIVNERLNREKNVIDSALNEALDRSLIETSKLDSELDLSNREKKLTHIIYTKSELSNINKSIIVYFIIGIIVIIISIYFWDKIVLDRKYYFGSAIIIGLIVKSILKKIKQNFQNFHALDINPVYIKIGKSVTTEEVNTFVFYNKILGTSFNIEDFKNINSKSKIDNTIQLIENSKEENTTIPHSKLHLCYIDNGPIKTISIDLNKVEADKLHFVKLISALRRSNEMQRKHIINTINGNEIEKISEEDNTVQDAQTAQSKLTHDIIIAETEEQSIGHNLDKYNCEVCFDRPKGFMYKGKKGAIKINPESIFLDYGVFNEENKSGKVVEPSIITNPEILISIDDDESARSVFWAFGSIVIGIIMIIGFRKSISKVVIGVSILLIGIYTIIRNWLNDYAVKFNPSYLTLSKSILKSGKDEVIPINNIASAYTNKSSDIDISLTIVLKGIKINDKDYINIETNMDETDRKTIIDTINSLTLMNIEERRAFLEKGIK